MKRRGPRTEPWGTSVVMRWVRTEGLELDEMSAN